MKTFDFNQVKDFTSVINAELDDCQNGEGMQCHSMDATLTFCAERCCKFADAVRHWGMDVFSGKVAFDAAAESLWRAELLKLFERARALLAIAIQAESDCYVLDGKKKLESALWNLSQLLPGGWVTPELSVGPAARNKIAFSDDDRERLASLTPLPADWKPANEVQAQAIRRARQGR